MASKNSSREEVGYGSKEEARCGVEVDGSSNGLNIVTLGFHQEQYSCVV